MAGLRNALLFGLASAVILRLMRGSKSREGSPVIDDSEQGVDAAPDATCPSKPESEWDKVQGDVVNKGGWLLSMVILVHGVFGTAAAVGAGMATFSIAVAWKMHALAGDKKGMMEGAAFDETVAPTNLNGTWIKDMQRSDPLDELFEALKLNRVIRTLTLLYRGVRIKQTKESFRMEAVFFGAAKYLKNVEEYPFTGEVRKCRRRDLRRGCHKGYVKWCGPKLQIIFEWSDPLGGTGADEFILIDSNELHVVSSIVKSNKTISIKSVYKRKGVK